MRAIIRKIATVLFGRLVPRRYVLNLAQNDIVALSEVTAHLMNARNTLYAAVSQAMQQGVPLVLDTSNQHIRLSNGHLLNYCYSEQDLSVIGVSVGTNGRDRAFELAVWRMLESSPFFCATGPLFVERLGLNYCTITGIDIALNTLFNQTMADNGARALSDS